MSAKRLSPLAKAATVVTLLAITTACSNLGTREQRTLTGGAIGAAGGATIGLIAGSPVIGALAGGAAGAAVGAFTDESQINLDTIFE